MRRLARTLAVMLVICYAASTAGCATPIKKEELDRKNALVQSLTDENAALRKQISSLSNEVDGLRRENLRLESEMRAKAERQKEKEREVRYQDVK